MNVRLGIAWLEGVFRSTAADPDDASDWLAGNDQTIVDRRRARDVEAMREAAAAAGGEVG